MDRLASQPSSCLPGVRVHRTPRCSVEVTGLEWSRSSFAPTRQLFRPLSKAQRRNRPRTPSHPGYTRQAGARRRLQADIETGGLTDLPPRPGDGDAGGRRIVPVQRFGDVEVLFTPGAESPVACLRNVAGSRTSPPSRILYAPRNALPLRSPLPPVSSTGGHAPVRREADFGLPRLCTLGRREHRQRRIVGTGGGNTGRGRRGR